MFKTSSHAEFLPPKTPNRSPDLRFWSLVEQDITSPWFYLQLVEIRDNKAYRSMLLVHTAHHLELVVNAQTDTEWIEQIQVVSPGHVNSKGNWAMEPLLEVKFSRDKLGSGWGYTYLIESGEIYFHSNEEALQRDQNDYLVFSASQHLNRR